MLNARLNATAIQDYKDSLKLDDFDEATQETILSEAAYTARQKAFDEGDDFFHKIANSKDYIALRCGLVTEDELVATYLESESRAQTMMCEKLTEQMLEEGVLTPNEIALAEMLRSLDDSVKYVTIHFNVDGAKASAKLSPQTLHRVAVRNDTFTSSHFKDTTAPLDFLLLEQWRDNRLNINDIESVTYGGKTLYVRDNNKAVAKEKKHEDVYER